MEDLNTTKSKKTYYDYNYLMQFCKENSLYLRKDYKNEKIIRETKIISKLSIQDCQNTFEKPFRVLVRGKNFGCKAHSKIIGQQKLKKTNMEKYGVGCSLQNESVKQKIKKTNVERYGVQYPSQNKEIRQKMKEKCMENHGVEYPSQNKEVRQKIKKTNTEKYGFSNPFQNEEIKQKIKKTNTEKYGAPYPSQNKKVRQKMRETNVERYGFEHVLQNEKIKEKIKETCYKHYGVKYPMQSEEIKEKFKQTCLLKYAAENPFQNEEIKQKIKKSNIEKRGVEYPIQSEEVRQKIKKTNMGRYGVEYVMQNSEISEKQRQSAYKIKIYTSPSGKKIQYQGYEHFALKELIENENIDEDDIVTSRAEVPIIWYKDENGKKHRYFTDILIKSQNRCIEVKSTWTFKKDIDFVFLKQKATIDTGYKCEIWVYDAGANKIDCFK